MSGARKPSEVFRGLAGYFEQSDGTIKWQDSQLAQMMREEADKLEREESSPTDSTDTPKPFEELERLVRELVSEQSEGGLATAFILNIAYVSPESQDGGGYVFIAPKVPVHVLLGLQQMGDVRLTELVAEGRSS